MSKTAIIIGAGITGVCTAEHLRRTGVRVTLIDRIEPGSADQASFGNAGLLARSAITPVSSPSLIAQLPQLLLWPNSAARMRWRSLAHLTPWGLAFLRNCTASKTRQIAGAIDMLIHDTVDQHVALAKGTAAAAFINTGTITYLYRRKADYASDRLGAQIKSELGVTPDYHDLATLKEIDPALGTHYQFGACYKHNGYLTSPSGYLRALLSHFTEQGGTFVRAEADRIEGQSLHLKDGTTLTADTIIVASGAWSNDLVGNLGHKVKMVAERGYHIMLKDANVAPTMPYITTDTRHGVTPMADGLRIAGTSEFAHADAAPDPKRFEYLQHSARRMYPDLTWKDRTTWMGHRPTTADSLPMVGRTKNNPNVIFAFGSQHLGLTMGPKIGQIVTDIVQDRHSNLDISALDVARFD